MTLSLGTEQKLVTMKDWVHGCTNIGHKEGSCECNDHGGCGHASKTTAILQGLEAY